MCITLLIELLEYLKPPPQSNYNNHCLPTAVFIAQVLLVGPSIKLHKEIISIENDMVKNPNWQEADQLAIYKRVRGVELGATEKQLQLTVRTGHEPGLPNSSPAP